MQNTVSSKRTFFEVAIKYMNAVLFSLKKKSKYSTHLKTTTTKKSKIYLTTVSQRYFKKTNPHLVKENSRQRENKIRSTQL